MAIREFITPGLTVVGGFIGGIYGGPVGATVGASIGGMIGSYLFPLGGPKGSGPPGLQENRIQISTYGIDIPKLWGTKRLAGNIIWLSEIEERYTSVRHEYTVHDGMGGGIGDDERHYYVRYRRYYCDLAIAFCEGEVASLNRIWINNVLFVDFRDPSGDSYPPGAGSLTGQNNWDVSSLVASQKYEIYYGSEDQSPSPTMQEHLGSAATPAFRGICYIVFKDFPVGEFGNIPTIEAEISYTGTNTNVHASINLNEVKNAVNWLRSSHPWTIDGNFVVCDGYSKFYILRNYSTQVLDIFEVPMVGQSGLNIKKVSGWGINPNNGQMVVCCSGYSTHNYWRRNLVYSSPGGELISDSGDMYINLLSQAYPAYSENYLFIGDQIWENYVTFAGGWIGYRGLCKVYSRDLEHEDGADGFGDLRIYKSDGSYVTTSFYYLAISSDGTYFYIKNWNSTINLGLGGSYYYVLRITPSSLYTYSGSYPSYRYMAVPYGGWEVISSNGSDDLFNFPVMFSNGTIFPNGYFSPGWDDWYTPQNTWYMYSDIATMAPAYRIYNDKTDAPLSTLIEDLCEDSGLTISTDVDAEDFDSSPMVKGYLLTRQSTAKVLLEQIKNIFFFDVGEIDWKIHFVKRGGASIVTISSDELGAFVSGGEPVDRLIELRKSDIGLPTHLVLNYESEGRDYDIVGQRAIRVDKVFTVPMNIDCPFVLNDETAKRIVERLLKAIWMAKSTFKFSLSPKYLYLAPTNVVTIGGREMRITDIVEAKGLLDFSAADENKGSYESEALSDDIRFRVIEIPNPNAVPVTKFELLDVPIVSLTDVEIGFYFVLFGESTGFAGGDLYQSTNLGGSFDAIDYYLDDTAIVGQCPEILGDGVQNCIDYTSSLEASFELTGGSFSNRPVPDTQTYNQTNLFAVGKTANGFEIIQAKTVTNNGDGSFTFSGLKRGLYGTGDRIGAHRANEVVIPLWSHTELRRVQSIVAFLGSTLLFSCSTDFNGRAINISNPKTLSSVAFEGAKPFPVCDIRGSRNSSGDLTVSWKRGDRKFFTVDELHDTNDIPMSESVEEYEVDFVNRFSGEVLRTEEATSAEITYLAADQVTDGCLEEVLHDGCSGSFSDNFTEYSYTSGWATFANGLMSLYIGSVGSSRGSNALANNLISRSGFCVFTFDAIIDYRLSSTAFATANAEISIVKSSPTYTTAASGYYRPEYGVGQNSFLMLSIVNTTGYSSGLAKFILIRRVNGTNTELGSYTVSSLTEFNWNSAGYKFDIICDFTNHTISVRLNDVEIISAVDFGSTIDTYLGSDVQLNFHNNNYSYYVYQYFDNIAISVPAINVGSKIQCNIYQMSSLVGRGKVATAILQ